MTKDEQEQRGREASALLGNAAYVDSWVGAFASLTNEWANSDDKDAAYREDLFRQIQGLKRARGLLEDMIENGKRAERELKEAREQYGYER